MEHKKFAQRLRELRQDAGMTHANLAERLGLGRTAVTNMETFSKPSIDVLCSLSSIFGVSMDYLAGFDAPEPPPKWVADLLPDLRVLDKPGREAVRALVKGLKK